MKFLFDLGGVFFDWNPKYYYKTVFKNVDEMNYFLNKVCNNEWNIKQDNGRLIVDAENELIEKFPNYTNEIKMYYSNHRKMLGSVYQDSIDLLLELKRKDYLCYVLSNWSAETFIGMTEDYLFLKEFDGIIISGEEKMMKPNEEIYKLALKRFNLIAEDTLFIDDKIENIESAKKLNFNTLHLIDPKKIIKEVYNFI
tara:strand:+ start:1829 stop:2419 length:591 start_codon:yes stop_codon:yes gene_type:complete